MRDIKGDTRSLDYSSCKSGRSWCVCSVGGLGSYPMGSSKWNCRFIAKGWDSSKDQNQTH